MAVFSSQRQAFNRTRHAYLATALAVADTHWTRLRGLLGLKPDDFRNGSGLWILPCHGVHTLGMGFPIDVVYLDGSLTVVHVESDLRPWRFAPVRMQAASVLELPRCTAADTGTDVGDRIEIVIDGVTVEEVQIGKVKINEMKIDGIKIEGVTTDGITAENDGRVQPA